MKSYGIEKLNFFFLMLQSEVFQKNVYFYFFTENLHDRRMIDVYKRQVYAYSKQIMQATC